MELDPINNEFNKDLNIKDEYEGRDLENKVLNRDPITGEPGSQPVGTAAGTTAGALAGAALGAVLGPVGAIAGAVAGGIAGAITGHEIGETVNPTHNAILTDDQPVETGVGAGAGAMIGAVVGSVAGPIGTAAGAAIGAAAGGYAGHETGDYMDERRAKKDVEELNDHTLTGDLTETDPVILERDTYVVDTVNVRDPLLDPKTEGYRTTPGATEVVRDKY